MSNELIVHRAINHLFEEDEFDAVFTDDVACAVLLCWEEVVAAMENLQRMGRIRVEEGSGAVLFSSDVQKESETSNGNY